MSLISWILVMKSAVLCMLNSYRTTTRLAHYSVYTHHASSDARPDVSKLEDPYFTSHHARCILATGRLKTQILKKLLGPSASSTSSEELAAPSDVGAPAAASTSIQFAATLRGVPGACD